jgi:hypothetical protein
MLGALRANIHLSEDPYFFTKKNILNEDGRI